MSKTAKVVLRNSECKLENEIKKMIDLKNNGSKDIKQWMDEWQRVLILPTKERARAEKYLMSLMESISFIFKAGHALYNAGLIASFDNGYRTKVVDIYPNRPRKELYSEGFNLGLGRGAMWLGWKIARNAMKRSRQEDICRERITESMIDRLTSDSGTKKEFPTTGSEATQETLDSCDRRAPGLRSRSGCFGGVGNQTMKRSFIARGDRKYLEMIFGRRFREHNPESLKQWLIRVS